MISQLLKLSALYFAVIDARSLIDEKEGQDDLSPNNALNEADLN